MIFILLDNLSVGVACTSQTAIAIVFVKDGIAQRITFRSDAKQWVVGVGSEQSTAWKDGGSSGWGAAVYLTQFLSRITRADGNGNIGVGTAARRIVGIKVVPALVVVNLLLLLPATLFSEFPAQFFLLLPTALFGEFPADLFLMLPALDFLQFAKPTLSCDLFLIDFGFRLLLRLWLRLWLWLLLWRFGFRFGKLFRLFRFRLRFGLRWKLGRWRR